MAGEQLEFGDNESTIALKRAWERALIPLAGKVNKVTFESYIRPIRPLRQEERTVTLGVASAFAREWLKRYTNLIQTTLEESLGSPLEIQYSILTVEERPLFGERDTVSEKDGKKAEDTLPSVLAAPTRSTFRPEPAATLMEEVPSLPLNEAYTFDTFIIGKSNRLAHAGAMAAAGAPGKVYNPLFIYGGSGLGKTHLLHAVVHAVRQENPHLRAALVDGENFTYHYVTALRERRTEEFRRYFRSIDLWLVDDIQFIASKEQTKEEFFHTFNALYQTGKQIIITSDRSPRELRTMDERLRSRFECGLIADVHSPELETRMAILEKRCAVEKWSVNKEVLYYIASAIQSNIRALEGALNRLVAYSSIMRSPCNIEVAQSVLGEYFIEKPISEQMRKGISMETIFRAVSEQFGTSIETLRGQRRDKEISQVRQVAMYLCRELTENGLAQIGAALGGRDHTTVQRAIAKIEANLTYDQSLQRTVQQIREKLDN